MSLGTQIVRAVQKEAAMQRPLPLTARARSPLPRGGTVEAEVVVQDNDRFSHMAEGIKVKAAQPTTRKAQTNAEALCQRASYLTERLQYVENDASGAAVVRSSPETMREKRAEYYEARVGSDEISLQRFQPNKAGAGRAAVPFCVTDETLERIVNDAADILAAAPRK
jgi:hypothetical protein